MGKSLDMKRPVSVTDQLKHHEFEGVDVTKGRRKKRNVWKERTIPESTF